jgi:hypothetical protein
MTNLFLLRRLRRVILGALPQKTGSDNRVVAAVMQGFRITLEDSRFEELVPRLNAIDVDARGFAYEGAGVALTVLDYFPPWRKQFEAFVRVIEDQYLIPVYIGAGLALGRMHSRRTEHFVQQQEHPVFRWMVMDGYGFQKGFYSQQPYIDQQKLPDNLSPYARRVFDQGLGRGLWFAKGESVERVTATIAAFPETRRADLWSGASFACAYAGKPLKRESYEQLWENAGPYRAQLSLAGALAAKRRIGLGHVTPQTDMACQVFCGLSAEMTAGVANDILKNLPPATTVPLHKIWRERIAAYFEARAAHMSEQSIGVDVA